MFYAYHYSKLLKMSAIEPDVKELIYLDLTLLSIHCVGSIMMDSLKGR